MFYLKNIIHIVSEKYMKIFWSMWRLFFHNILMNCMELQMDQKFHSLRYVRHFFFNLENKKVEKNWKITYFCSFFYFTLMILFLEWLIKNHMEDYWDQHQLFVIRKIRWEQILAFWNFKNLLICSITVISVFDFYLPCKKIAR